jgi:outer membrane protein OmpA-like peptidoglycan-associated protein
MPHQGAQQDKNHAALGAIIGAVAGAVVGGQLDDDGNRDKGIILGALVGAASGAGIGHTMDLQEQAFRDELAAEQRRSDVAIERVRDDLLKLTFDNEITFDFNQISIKPSFLNSLTKVSQVMAKYQSSAQVVGHTDSRGTEAYNQLLSERRAAAVANYLIDSGISASLIDSEGRGEYEPRESNVTEAGRALNRRVELFIRPQAN